MCQRAETGHEINDVEHEHFRSKIRKANDSSSSPGLLNDKPQDLDRLEEDEKRSNCNHRDEAGANAPASKISNNKNNLANQLINHHK